MVTLKFLKNRALDIIQIKKHLDIEEASKTIREGMTFRGPNVWILAFSVVIASVGLNLNSIPVIIGAMLITPLMGPIYAIGLGLGTNDTKLIKDAFVNFLIIVGIALIASALYFRITPLRFADLTELEARCHPSIYQVIIALAGGLAGIFEISQKRTQSSVLSGVAIATALMPPLCTAGYGIAHLNPHFFLGALFQFLINLVFIALATYSMVKYFEFPEANFMDEKTAKRTKNWITLAVVVIVVPSLWSAVDMIRYNNFEIKVEDFVNENREIERAYIYDFTTENHNGGIATIKVAGETLKAETKQALIASAESFGIRENQLIIKEQSLTSETEDRSEILMKGIYERTDAEINKKEAQIRELESELNKYRATDIPYTQILQELKTQYPEIKDVAISKGAIAYSDSLRTAERTIVVAGTNPLLGPLKVQKLTSWLRVRLNDTTVVVINQKPDAVK